MSDRILYLIHRHDWTSTRIADVLRDMGYAVDFLCHPDDEPLPGDTSQWAGIVISGGLEGSMTTPERWPWFLDEIAFAKREIDAGKPVLGLCLGAQAIALAYGGRGGPRPDGLMELGFYGLEPTAAGREIFAGLDRVYQAHYEGVMALPDGSELLASSEMFPVQAFRHGSAIGLQCHPDAKLADLKGWIADNEAEAARPGRQPAAEQLRLAEDHEAAIQAWTERFLNDWIGPAGERRAA